MLNAAGSAVPLCNETFCQCPGVGFCHQEWYLSLVQKMRRHVEHNKEREERLWTVTDGGTVKEGGRHIEKKHNKNILNWS